MNVRRFILSFAAVMNLLLVDQLVKAAAVYYLKDSPPVVVLPDLFRLAYVENRGAAWGLFQGHVWPLALFSILALAFLIWRRREVFMPGWSGAVCECLLYAGILGNMIDRLTRGCVVDLFDFHWGVHHFPCFNVADAYITLSVGLLLAAGFFRKDEGASRDPA